MQDAEKRNYEEWDKKWESILWQLEDYQDAKDHPQAQVISIEVEELFVGLLFLCPFLFNSNSGACRFKQRFKSFIDQYELRELHFHSLLRSKEIEVQYHMARYEKEKKTAEAEATRSRALNAQVLTFSKTETELRNQLNIYVEKFKQVSSEVVFPGHLPFICHISVPRIFLSDHP